MINPRTGLPETPEEKRLREAFQPLGFDPAAVAPAPVAPGPPLDPASMTHVAPRPGGSMLDSVANVTARPPDIDYAPVAQSPNPPGITAPAPGLEVLGRTVTSPTTTRRVAGAMSKQGMAEAEAAKLAGDRAIDLKTDATVQSAEVEQQRADMKAREEAAAFQQRQQAQAAREAEIARLRGDEDKAVAQMQKSSKITTLWEDKGAAPTVIQAFLKGLSTYAHVRAGGQGTAPAVEAFMQVEAADRQKKMDQFARDKEFVNLAKANSADAQKAWTQKQHELDLEKQAKLGVFMAQIDSLAAKVKTPAAQAAGEAEKAAAAAELAKLKINQGAHYDATVQSGGTSTQMAPAGTIAAKNAKEERPLSEQAKLAIKNSDQFQKLAAQQAALIAKHKGFPVGGEDATAFVNNDRAMARLQQVGQSDSDQKAAEEQQDAPSLARRLVGGTKNYMKNLEVNASRLADAAATSYQLEGRSVAQPSAPAQAQQAPLMDKVKVMSAALTDPNTPAADKVKIKAWLARKEQERKAAGVAP